MSTCWTWRAIALGLAFALAALLHQTHVLFAPALLCLLIARRCRWSNIIATLIAYGGAVFLTYFIVHGVSFGRWDIASMIRWSLWYAREPSFAGAYGLPPTWSDVPAALSAWAALLSAEPWPLPLRLLFVEGLLVLLAATTLVRARRSLTQRGDLAFLLLWIAAYGGFAFWWEPNNIEFLTPVAPPLLLLLAYAHGQSPPSLRPGVGGKIGAAAILVFTFVTTLVGPVRHMHWPRNYAAMDKLILTRVRANDVVVTRGACSRYLAYFHNREPHVIVGLHWGRQYDAGRLPDYCARLQRQIDAALDADRTVYTLDYPFGESVTARAPAPPSDKATKEMTKADMARFYARYRLETIEHAEGWIARVSRRENAAP